MHTKISTAHYLFWIALICFQWALGFYLRDSGFLALRVFLLAEAALGTILLTLAKTLLAWPYFYAWIVASVMHEAISAFLLMAMVNAIRVRALPTRTSLLPIQIALLFSFAVAIYTSSIALHSLAHLAPWRLILSWDHAFWYAMCCMLVFAPFYAVAIGATIPRHLAITLAGFGLYATSNTGALAIMIAKRTGGGFEYLSDFVYCISLVSWFIAAHLKATTSAPNEPATVLGIPQIIDTEQGI